MLDQHVFKYGVLKNWAAVINLCYLYKIQMIESMGGKEISLYQAKANAQQSVAALVWE